MKRLVLSMSVIVLSVGMSSVFVPAVSAATSVTPVHITTVNAMQDTEKYSINVKMNARGVILKNICKFTNTAPRDRSKLVCTSVVSVGMVTDPSPDFPGTWARFSGSMDIYNSSGVFSSTEAYSMYVQDNATPGDNADKIILVLGNTASAITLTSGDIIVSNL